MKKKAAKNKSGSTRAHVVSYTLARNRLAEKMRQVCLDRSPIIITRQDAESCVLMSLADYQAIEETAYLLRGPKNAKRLAESLDQVSSGKVKTGRLAA